HHHYFREAVRHTERHEYGKCEDRVTGPGKSKKKAAHRGEPYSQPSRLEPIGDRTRERLAGDHPAGERRKRPAVAACSQTEPGGELRESRIDEAGRQRCQGER